MTGSGSPHLRARDGRPQTTTPAELLFDLVYAFAITQVSHLLIAHLSFRSAVHAALLFFVIWWAWIYTTWMVNWFDPGTSRVRLIVVGCGLSSLLMAAAVPTAFTTHPVLFAGAYVILQVGRNVAAAVLLERDHTLRRVLERLVAWSVLSGSFWLAGAFAPPSARLAIWGAALLLDLVAPLVGYWTPGLGRSGTLDYPVEGGHFAERFQSFLIIVLGESIVVTGATASAGPLDAVSVLALGVAFLITGGLWWLYFGIVAEHSRRRIAEADDPALLARDAYTYLHLPIVAGVIMVSVGDDLLISHPTDTLNTAGIVMLAGGPALFLAGEVLFRIRMTASVGRPRVVAVVGLLVAGVLAGGGSALLVGAAVVSVLSALALWEQRGLRNAV
ncbi:MAG TPA: low temperature requirement protein A [Solirubrobacteraceae bacterium]|nr:low temperature requirement protein A [Solirubrobacteraceae bacterium]